MKALSIGWALLILVLCSLPGQSVPDLNLFGLDKLGHFGMFFLGALVWSRTWPDRLVQILIVGLAFSVGTEVYQGLAPFLSRVADPLDVVADAVGLLAGLAVVLGLRRRRRTAALV